MAQKDLRLMMVFADERGQIYDHPTLRMVCRKGREWVLPNPRESIPLPKESELFLLPGRKAVGFSDESGATEVYEDGLAVAAFLAPAHTLAAHPAYVTDPGAPILPLFAYGAVGFANDRFYVCAKKVDPDPRQEFSGIQRRQIEQGARELCRQYPDNRLIAHIVGNCVAKYDCPAARNFALGRYEAPIPSAQSCNARCLGCISLQEEDSDIAVTPQCRLTFTPTVAEIVQVMRVHALREQKHPIFSFGQGCEGDPLQNADLLAESIAAYRALAARESDGSGHGTINCNTNASRPEVISRLAQAGLTSLRVSLNSAREAVYTRYYRPKGYDFSSVVESIREARRHNLFISLNYLFFPGVSDTEEELEALQNLVSLGVSMIQWRNLNIDPEWYLSKMEAVLPAATFGMGLSTFMKRLKSACPWLRYGYFNPWLDDHPELEAPNPA